MPRTFRSWRNFALLTIAFALGALRTESDIAAEPGSGFRSTDRVAAAASDTCVPTSGDISGVCRSSTVRLASH